MILSRRSLFAGGAVLLAAPAIVRVASLMPISVPKPQLLTYRIGSFAISEGEVVFHSGITFANLTGKTLTPTSSEIYNAAILGLKYRLTT